MPRLCAASFAFRAGPWHDCCSTWGMTKNCLGLCGLALSLGCAWMALGCASDQKSAVTAEEVRDGEALPPAPPVPLAPAPTATSEVAPAPTPAAPMAEKTSAQETLTEPQIAKVTELVNTAEVAQARLAQRRAKAQAVKQFADTMIKHHEQARQEQAKIAQRLKLSPADSSTADKLKSDGEAQLAQLKEIDAASFDSAYISSQIDGHQQALDLLDTQLIPSAKTPEVVSALQTARALVEQHLRDARNLRQ